jgi:hypothetical protein
MKDRAALRRKLLLWSLVASAILATITAVLPKVERATDTFIAEESERLFRPVQEFYDLSRQVREAVRCPDPDVIRSTLPLALDLLRKSQRFRRDWNYGNALHYGYLALGRCALLDGNTQQAKEYLLLASDTPGSPQLNDYGPDMTLALELLQCGDQDTVIEYFSRCSHFWHNRGKSPLKDWADDVRHGRTPEFGQRAGIPMGTHA